MKPDPAQSLGKSTGDDELVVFPVLSDGEGMLGVKIPASFVSARFVAVHELGAQRHGCHPLNASRDEELINESLGLSSLLAARSLVKFNTEACVHSMFTGHESRVRHPLWTRLNCAAGQPTGTVRTVTLYQRPPKYRRAVSPIRWRQNSPTVSPLLSISILSAAG